MNQPKYYDEIYKIMNEQFFRLTSLEQELWFILKKSKPIESLKNQLFIPEHSSIINFKTVNKKHRIYFTFDVLGKIDENPDTLYKVNGSCFDSKQGKNIVYTIQNAKKNYLIGTYVDNYINIKNKVIFNEVTYVNTRANTSRTEYVCLKIKTSVDKMEEFIIDIDSEIYKLYLSKQIDMTTLCNLALLQEYKQITNETKDFIKKLDKKFI